MPDVKKATPLIFPFLSARVVKTTLTIREATAIRSVADWFAGTISWRVKFRNGEEKNFVSPIRTTPWGSIKGPAEYDSPSDADLKSQELSHEPSALNIDGGLPALKP